MGIEIKTYDGRVLYVSQSATTVREALGEAVKNRANLVEANLAGANLDEENLDGANLVEASLAGASLADAYLVGANLDGANLAGANLDGANLDGASLAGVNLAGTKGLDWSGVAEALKQAIRVMNDGGKHWTKGTLARYLEDGSKAYCAIGGVSACSSGNTTTLALCLVASVAGGDTAAFNDHPATTWEDVQAVFATTIRHAERFAASS